MLFFPCDTLQNAQQAIEASKKGYGVGIDFNGPFAKLAWAEIRFQQLGEI